MDLNKKNSVAVFINSSENTADIANHFFASFKKYWPNCPYDIYVGANKYSSRDNELSTIKVIAEVSGWKTETIKQIEIIKEIDPNVKHIIIFLDDFIINDKIDNDSIISVVNTAVLNNLKYLRFRTLDECVAVKIINRVKCYINNELYFEVRKDHPYFSSLQVALWDIDHFLKIIKESKNIWNFECINYMSENHYSTSKNIISYKHIVEKGKWDFNADIWCNKSIGYFNKGNRESRKLNFIEINFLYLRKISFNIFGYLPSRLRKLLIYK